MQRCGCGWIGYIHANRRGRSWPECAKAEGAERGKRRGGSKGASSLRCHATTWPKMAKLNWTEYKFCICGRAWNGSAATWRAMRWRWADADHRRRLPHLSPQPPLVGWDCSSAAVAVRKLIEKLAALITRPPLRPYRLPWTALLARVFAHDVTVCPACAWSPRWPALSRSGAIYTGNLRATLSDFV